MKVRNLQLKEALGRMTTPEIQKELDNMDTIIDVFIHELNYSIHESYKNDYIKGINRHMFEIYM